MRNECIYVCNVRLFIYLSVFVICSMMDALIYSLHVYFLIKHTFDSFFSLSLSLALFVLKENVYLNVTSNNKYILIYSNDWSKRYERNFDNSQLTGREKKLIYLIVKVMNFFEMNERILCVLFVIYWYNQTWVECAFCFLFTDNKKAKQYTTDILDFTRKKKNVDIISIHRLKNRCPNSKRTRNRTWRKKSALHDCFLYLILLLIKNQQFTILFITDYNVFFKTLWCTIWLSSSIINSRKSKIKFIHMPIFLCSIN